MREFGDIYSEDTWAESERSVGSHLLLVARTVAAFGRATEQLDVADLAVCTGFHDQTLVTRIREQCFRPRS